MVLGLNSYYVDLPRLVEHCQGDFGSGCALLQGNGVLAQLFFDKAEHLNGSYTDSAEALAGDRAVQRILEEAPRAGLAIQVHAISPANIYLWANVPDADLVYGNLSTEFTDLMGLIRKMGRESLSGYLEVCPEDPAAGGVIFLSDGKVVGGSYGGTGAEPASPQEEVQRLVTRNRDDTAVFHVGRFRDHPRPQPVGEGARDTADNRDALPAIEELLNQVGDLFTAARRSQSTYRTMLNRKFLEKSETYPFLDPFAAEFTYREGRVEFASEVDAAHLTRAVVECLRELAREQRVLEEFRSLLAHWSARHRHPLAASLPGDAAAEDGMATDGAR